MGATTTFDWRGGDFYRDVEFAAKQGLTSAGQVAVNAIKQDMSKHSPPAPAGQAPAVRTGRLRSSVTKTTPYRSGARMVSIRIGSPVEYGKFLESGTTRMAARPWLRPTATGKASEMRTAFVNRASQALARRVASRGGAA